ncbi:MAG: hypothetical protein AAF927_07540 [Bacteroidota bacterium]
MKYLILSLSFLAALITFSACEPISLNADVDYYLEFTDSKQVDQLGFSFTGARALQVFEDGSEAIRTVYLSETPFTVDFAEPVEPLLLGSSDIEPSAIKSLDLFWSEVSVTFKGEKLALDYEALSTHEAVIDFAAQEKKTVTLILDLDASFIEQPNGSFIFKPVISLKQ